MQNQISISYGHDFIRMDFIRLMNNVLFHKQLEVREGLTFLRMKKRSLVKAR